MIRRGDLPKGLLAHVQSRSGVHPAPPPPPPGAPLTLQAVTWTPPVGTHLAPGTLSVFVTTLLLHAGGTVGSKNETGLSTPCLFTPTPGVPGTNLSPALVFSSSTCEKPFSPNSASPRKPFLNVPTGDEFRAGSKPPSFTSENLGFLLVRSWSVDSWGLTAS